MRKLIIFDIDGTLLLTGGAGKEAFNRVFKKYYGIESAWFDIRPDGRTDPSLIEELFQKNFGKNPSFREYRRIAAAYAEAMAETLAQAERFRLMPGVTDLLHRIVRDRLGVLGLATGNFESTARQKLLRAGLSEFFTFGGYGSDHAHRIELTRIAVERGRQQLGYLISNEDIILVGDTPQDIQCGCRLGLTTVAVATGSTPHTALAEARPDFLVDNFMPLEEVILLFE